MLAAGKLVRIMAAVIGQADEREQFGHARFARFGAAAAQAESDVVGHIQVRKQGVILKHHADAAQMRRHKQAAV